MAKDKTDGRSGREEPFDSNPSARDFLIDNHDWLEARCRHSMERAGCPTPHSCGEELCQERTIKSVKEGLWGDVKNQRAYISRIVSREAAEKKQQCGCGEAVDIEDENELDAHIARSRPADVWAAAKNMESSTLLREVAELLSEDERRILLCTAQGLRAAETARLLDISETALRQRKSRLMKKLRKLFAGESEEGETRRSDF